MGDKMVSAIQEVEPVDQRIELIYGNTTCQTPLVSPNDHVNSQHLTSTVGLESTQIKPYQASSLKHRSCIEGRAAAGSRWGQRAKGLVLNTKK